MSGKPYPGGVEEIRKLNARLVVATKLLEEKDKELGHLSRVTKEREKLGEECVNISRDIKGLLEKMDLSSPGNFGWEGRFVWFVGEIIRQAEDDALKKYSACSN